MFSFFKSIFSADSNADGASNSSSFSTRHDSPTVVNPATGLPMLDNSYSTVDYGGSSYGTDIHSNAFWSQSSAFDSTACWSSNSSSSCSFDDPFKTY